MYKRQTLDTSGNPFTREEPYFSKFNELMKYTDLLLLDIMLPVMDGWSVLRTIRQDYGSAESYLEAEYGLTPARLMRLRRMYLE